MKEEKNKEMHHLTKKLSFSYLYGNDNKKKKKKKTQPAVVQERTRAIQGKTEQILWRSTLVR